MGLDLERGRRVYDWWHCSAPLEPVEQPHDPASSGSDRLRSSTIRSAGDPDRETAPPTDVRGTALALNGPNVIPIPNKRTGVMKRPEINITPIERAGRIIVGAVGVIGGLVLLGSASGALLVVLEALLVLAGLDLLVTGALGHCPLYRKLGYTPASLRGSA
jgi:hypothetical protein